MAELIAATTAAANSADFTCVSSTGLSCYGASGSETVGRVERKNSDGTYSVLTSRLNPEKAPVSVMLTGIQEDLVIVKPGTYRFVKLETTGTVGIDVEEG